MTNQQKIVIRLKFGYKPFPILEICTPPVNNHCLKLDEEYLKITEMLLSGLGIPENLINPQPQYRGIRNKQDMVDLIDILDQEERRY